MSQREIKFRGKQHTWIVGGFNKLFDGTCEILTDLETFQVDTNSIGQFTGLKDRSEVEIFEGDILQFWNDRGMKGSISFVDGSFVINWIRPKRIRPDNFYESHIQQQRIIDTTYLLNSGAIIIGNTFDNPELLTQK